MVVNLSISAPLPPPGTFGGFPIAGQSKHFVVTYAAEDDADAYVRALAIVDSCEQDLQILESWFNCDFNASRYAIWVHVGPGTDGGGASNSGYTTSQSPNMWVSGTYQTNLTNGTDPAANPIKSEVARMLFVAELSEILMDFIGDVWNPHVSSGEALSRFLAARLHPLGYYSPPYGPSVNKWIQTKLGSDPATDPSVDSISVNDLTDGNVLSYGCGLLFLYFLEYQHNFSVEKIIQAGAETPANAFQTATLADIFTTLTGQPQSTAFPPFQKLMQNHITSPATFVTPVDNIFPLFDQPNVSLNIGSDLSVRPLDPFSVQQLPQTVALKAGPFCPVKEYKYHSLQATDTITVHAETTGLAQATFQWTVGGVALAASSGKAEVKFNVTNTVPHETIESAVAMSIGFSIKVDSNKSSTLMFWNNEFPGNGNIDISVAATEAAYKATADEVYQMETRHYSMDWPWYLDVQNCNHNNFSEALNAAARIRQMIATMNNQPDPPPQLYRALSTELRHYQTLLRNLTGENQGLEKGMNSLIARQAPQPAQTIELPAQRGFHPVSVPWQEVTSKTNQVGAERDADKGPKV